jgi:hypothetical protein
MSGGGGKGGSTTSQVQVPQWLNDAAQGNVAKANEMSKIGFPDYRGPDVAAFTPMQQSAFQNTSDAASAFGMAPSPGTAGMPAPTMYANGVQGFSSAPIYDQARAEMQRLNPAQYAAINAPFIDPRTGAQPVGVYGGGGGGGSGAAARRDAVSAKTQQQRTDEAREAHRIRQGNK